MLIAESLNATVTAAASASALVCARVHRNFCVRIHETIHRFPFHSAFFFLPILFANKATFASTSRTSSSFEAGSLCVRESGVSQYAYGVKSEKSRFRSFHFSRISIDFFDFVSCAVAAADFCSVSCIRRVQQTLFIAVMCEHWRKIKMKRKRTERKKTEQKKRKRKRKQEQASTGNLFMFISNRAIHIIRLLREHEPTAERRKKCNKKKFKNANNHNNAQFQMVRRSTYAWRAHCEDVQKTMELYRIVSRAISKM